MKIVVSEITEKYILLKYPHLTKRDIAILFEFGKFVRYPVETIFKSKYQYIKNSSYALDVPEGIAQHLNVGRTIELVQGEDGVIYTVYS